MLLKFFLLTLLSAVTALPALAQHRAYTPANDTIRHLPLKAQLPPAVMETSGLCYTSGQLWTLNDSGNVPVLFQLDSASGRVVQRVRLTNFANVDWEDLTADAHYLYVGDFGNNNGTRRNLRVLRLPRPAPADSTAQAEAIAFSYPDQTDFTSRPNQQNFDCEAFFVAHDSLHLFTKNWQDQRTCYYTLPTAPGAYVAHLRGSFATNGLITAAALNPAGTVAALLGYRVQDGSAFLWLLQGSGSSFLRGTERRVELPSVLEIGQVEGICFVVNSRVFISNEALSKLIFNVPPQLYALGLGPWLGVGRPSPRRKSYGTPMRQAPSPKKRRSVGEANR